MLFSGFSATYKFAKYSSVRILFCNIIFMRNCIGVSTRFKCTKVVSNSITKKKTTDEAPWRIIFFGSDDFSLASLKPLTAKLRTGTLLSELGVVSSPGTIVHKFATDENLPIHEWPPATSILQNYDLGMVVAYGKLIPAEMINSLPLGILNVHGSLLPRWRGAAPVEHAIMNGDTETGVTIFRIKPEKFDIGDIVRQYRCSIAPNETAVEVRTRLATFGAKLLLECVRDLPRCVTMATSQPSEGVSYAPKLTPSYAQLTWNNQTAQQVYNRHRALAHIHPLTTWWYGRPVRLQNISLAPVSQQTTFKPQNSTASSCKSALDFLNDIQPVNRANSDSNSRPGRIKYSHKSKVLTIECADGASVICDNLRVLQKKMSATDFYNGFLSKVSEADWVFGVQSREVG
ncbi:methionyl-tRNA formyltransferase, mitochondrial [Nilaparvata lugens]|uniref:methionyl-tRNA formyltransferase, mitochondrial n=1 Tax=Nilaparvata lugens TaxID=108931 RepID=UPI000B98F9F6|nr:methionyl-tRNA formyltransferase, mitochondrial [Nilaparvata lugens]